MKTNTFVHKYLKGLINKDDEVVDMTVGNGNDTYLLCKLAKRVIGFDINEEAINNTKERIKEFDNYELILDNHINVDKYIKNKMKLFIFNLGYLPHSSSPSTTKAEETLIAFKKAYELLINNGYIIITFYVGHKGGFDEYYLLNKYFNENNILVIEKYQAKSSILEPITFIIKKV